jgi:hypothetical protein
MRLSYLLLGWLPWAPLGSSEVILKGAEVLGPASVFCHQAQEVPEAFTLLRVGMGD